MWREIFAVDVGESFGSFCFDVYKEEHGAHPAVHVRLSERGAVGLRAVGVATVAAEPAAVQLGPGGLPKMLVDWLTTLMRFLDGV